jgi:hypothetical protein
MRELGQPAFLAANRAERECAEEGEQPYNYVLQMGGYEWQAASECTIAGWVLKRAFNSEK